MDIIVSIFSLLGGFLLLLASGHFLVKGSVSMARRIGVSTLVIGVTVVSFATSAPELIVSLQAALTGHPEIAIGNVIGSNISNIALVLALTAIITPIPVQRNSIIIDWPIMMISGLLLLAFIYISFGGNNNEPAMFLERWEGILFYVLLIIYIYWSIHKSRKDEKLLNNQKIPEIHKPVYLTVFWILISAGGLWIGSKLLISGATFIAEKSGLSERIISITLIAFGTSVPELATSVIAAFKKETDISIGNIIGSNIFNIFGILGLTAIVKKIEVSVDFISDIIWMLGISVLLLILILPIKGGILKRYSGMILLLAYIVYVVYLFIFEG